MKQQSTRQYVRILWGDLVEELARAYRAHTLPDSVPRADLYEAGDTPRLLYKFLEAETANERKHRQFLSEIPQPRGWSVDTAARVLILSRIADGVGAGGDRIELQDFLFANVTGCQCLVLGKMLRGVLSSEWVKAAAALDYAELANGRGLVS